MHTLEKIQLRCIKIIHKKSKYESNEIIKSFPGYCTLTNIFDKLNLRFLNNSLENKNEIIIDLHRDYREYSDSRVLKRKTLLCDYKTKIIV
jgi:hypothetical protein